MDWHQGTRYLQNPEQCIAWQRVRQLKTEEVTVYPTVIQISRGGPILEVEGIIAFISNIDRRRHELAVGDTCPCKIIDVRQEHYPSVRLIRSETFTLLRQLKIGQLLWGKVSAVKIYGIWVDLGGLYGFTHRSKITSYSDSVFPQDLFVVGDNISVVISEIKLELASISLQPLS